MPRLALAVIATLPSFLTSLAPSGLGPRLGSGSRSGGGAARLRAADARRARPRSTRLLGGGVTVEGCRVQPPGRQRGQFVDCLHGGKADFMRGLPYDRHPAVRAADAREAGVPNGVCASEALKHFVAELKTILATPRLWTSVLALEATAYLMAEIHQPLHDADNGDHSGDRVRVILPGALKAKASLYGVWDNDLVAERHRRLGRDRPALSAACSPTRTADAWSQGDIDAWVAQGHEVALHTVYGAAAPAAGLQQDCPISRRGSVPTTSPPPSPVVREQLAKAGVRLAAVLNASPALSLRATARGATRRALGAQGPETASIQPAGRRRPVSDSRLAGVSARRGRRRRWRSGAGRVA